MSKVGLCSLLIFFLSACGKPVAESRSFEEEQKEFERIAVAARLSRDYDRAKALRPYYSVISREHHKGGKTSVKLRLTKPLPAQDIGVIARQVKSYAGTPFFITIYLPDMDESSMCWATAHFRPALNVEIIGMTPEKLASVSKASVPQGELIGAWIDRTPRVGGKITIVKDEDGLTLQTNYQDGSKGKQRVRETRGPTGRRFDPVPPSPHGDHFVLDRSGNLQIRDAEGLITTARAIK